MPRTYGNCGPVVTAARGLELPDPNVSRLDADAVRARASARAATPVGVDQQYVDVDQVQEQADTGPVGPVVCDVRGVVVAGEYVARTGQRWHRPCQAKHAAGAAVREVA